MSKDNVVDESKANDPGEIARLVLYDAAGWARAALRAAIEKYPEQVKQLGKADGKFSVQVADILSPNPCVILGYEYEGHSLELARVQLKMIDGKPTIVR